MASTNRRPDRVAEAIRVEVATFLSQDVKDPRILGLVTVTGVDVSRDLHSATVFVSIYGSDAERAATMEGLASVANHLRARIGRALRLRLAPEIVFRQDDSIARAARIETLLSQIKDSPVREDAEDDRET
jgi:ribosome-binding factor A